MYRCTHGGYVRSMGSSTGSSTASSTPSSNPLYRSIYMDWLDVVSMVACIVAWPIVVVLVFLY